MVKGRKRDSKRIYLYICFIGIVFTIGIMSFSAYSGTKRRKDAAYHLLELYGVRTEALLNNLFHKTDILESIVIANHGQIDEETFNNLAASLMDETGIRAIQCLPEGIVTYCYPIEGNKSAIGSDVFEMPERKEDANLALQTKKIALSGPYYLTQGGLGLVARNPIFLTNSDGEDEFWGFSVVVLDLPVALEPIMLCEMVNTGYEYRLSTEVNGEVVVVDQSFRGEDRLNHKLIKKLEGSPGKDYIEAAINVPNHVWHLMVVPVNGWFSRRLLVFECVIGISFTLLFGVITFLLEQRGTQMEQYATTDELTGLYNRRRLKEYMDIRCRDEQAMFIMFYVDLNRFKKINDTMGHLCGDAVLVESGKRLKTAIGEAGSVYRIGGDEFIALMEQNVTGNPCAIKARQIEMELEKPFLYEEKPVAISASIGYARFPQEGKNLDELIKLADTRMYREKGVVKEEKT